MIRGVTRISSLKRRVVREFRRRVHRERRRRCTQCGLRILAVGGSVFLVGRGGQMCRRSSRRRIGREAGMVVDMDPSWREREMVRAILVVVSGMS